MSNKIGYNPEEMDNAAVMAGAELSRIPDKSIEIMCIWFTKHYMKAGHKRLGRIVVQNGKRLMKDTTVMKRYEEQEL